MKKVWVISFIRPDGHDPGEIDCVVFANESDARRWMEEAYFTEDDQVDLMEREIW